MELSHFVYICLYLRLEFRRIPWNDACQISLCFQSYAPFFDDPILFTSFPSEWIAPREDVGATLCQHEITSQLSRL